MDSYWSPTTPLFPSYFNTNLYAPAQAFQFENDIKDNVFDEAFEDFTWTPIQCEYLHKLDDFRLPESFGQPIELPEVVLNNPQPTPCISSISATPGLQSESLSSPATRETPKKTRKPYKKRKPLSEEQIIKKRERFLGRNRLAASKCRLKQKGLQDQLVEDVKASESLNEALKSQRTELLHEIACLERLVALCQTNSLRPKATDQRPGGSMYKCT